MIKVNVTITIEAECENTVTEIPMITIPKEYKNPKTQISTTVSSEEHFKICLVDENEIKYKLPKSPRS